MRPTNPANPARVNHSRLGADWERELDATHQWYRTQRLVDVRKQPHVWEPIFGAKFGAVSRKVPGDMLAQTVSGKYLIRRKGDVDYIGGGGGILVAFDAKRFDGDRFSLTAVEPHQIRALLDRERCGWTAGLLLKFAEHDRAFFFGASELDARYTAMIRGRVRGKSVRGTASISLADAAGEGREFFKNTKNGLWDWHATLG